MSPELSILRREIQRERAILRATLEQGWTRGYHLTPAERAAARVSRANILAAAVRYCRLADAGRKLVGLPRLTERT